MLYSSSSLVSVEYSKLGPWGIKEMACITLIEQYKKKYLIKTPECKMKIHVDWHIDIPHLYNAIIFETNEDCLLFYDH